jgi:hypothetical protein
MPSSMNITLDTELFTTFDSVISIIIFVLIQITLHKFWYVATRYK